MQVNVRLFATFRNGRFKEQVRDYASGVRVEDVIRDLNIDAGEIGMIMLEGKHAEADQVLNEGANLSLFPLLGGG